MKSGKLSMAEKYEIQGRLHESRKAGKPDLEAVKEIADSMDRRETLVTKYVEEELDGIQETVVKVQEEKVKPIIKIPQDMFNDVVAKIEAQGLTKPDAKELAQKSVKKIAKFPTTVDAIFSLAMKGIKAKHVMGKRTAGGNRGVSVMTPAASARIDETDRSSTSRSARGNIYVPSEDKIV